MLVHCRSLVYRDDRFWCWWLVSEGTVWPDRVVVNPPFFDDDFGFRQRVKDFTIEKFVPEPSIEALTIPILPR